jgi:hypothetical protein
MYATALAWREIGHSMVHFSRAFELPGSTAVQSVPCDRPVRRMSCSLVRQPPRNGQASGHAFAAAPRRHREALRGVELQRRWRAVCVLSRKGSWMKPRLPNLPIASVLGHGTCYGCFSVIQARLGAKSLPRGVCRLAKRLIDQTTMGLSDIAFAAGFRSVRRFNDAFRATYGCPPSSFRGAVRRRWSSDRTEPLCDTALNLVDGR